VRQISPASADRLDPHFRRVQNYVSNSVAERLDGQGDPASKFPPLQVDFELEAVVSDMELKVTALGLRRGPGFSPRRRERVEWRRVECRPAAEKNRVEKRIVYRHEPPVGDCGASSST
jgi:hypothetical protein